MHGWSRGPHVVGDWWECSDCDNQATRRDGGEREAIAHVQETGHTVVVIHRSARAFVGALDVGTPEEPRQTAAGLPQRVPGETRAAPRGGSDARQ